MTVYDAHPLDGRAGRVLERQGAFRSLHRHAVVGHREITALDGHVLAAVDVDAVRARSLLVVVGHEKPRVFHPHLTTTVEVQIPELGVLERHPVDHDAARVLDQRQTGACDAEISEIPGIGRRAAPFPKFVPDRPAGAIEDAFAVDAKAVAAVRVDQGRTKAFLEVPLDARAARGEVGLVGRATQHRVFLQVEIHAGLEKKRAADEDARRHDHRAAALGGEPVDGRLDRARGEGRGVADRAGVRDRPSARQGVFPDAVGHVRARGRGAGRRKQKRKNNHAGNGNHGAKA